MRYAMVLLLAGCTAAPATSSPDLAPQKSEAQLAGDAFWKAFRSQSYADVGKVRDDLQAAYAKDPRNPSNTLLLGHANLWTLAEFGRDPRDPSALPARAMDALKYFGEAAQLAPDDHRIGGWLGALEIALGMITGNGAIADAGQQHLDAAIAAFPEFNLFVRALVNGQLAADSPEFAAGLEAMWETLDLCAGETVDRAEPDFSKYFARKTTTGPERVCWNDDLARHNFEGFFLYMGDLLVKANQVDTAAKIYANAQKIDTYSQWPFAAELERRIREAAARAALYRDGDLMNDPPLANQTATACASCHADGG
jgi:hypothetical protein